MDRILVYNGYGTKEDVVLFGHMFQKYDVKEARKDARLWSNLKNAIRKYHIKAYSNISFDLKVNGVKHKVETNELGYFRVHFKPNESTSGWHHANLVFNDKELFANYLILGKSPIVISDIDDTLLYSMVHKFWKKMHLLMFKNGLQRQRVSQFDQIQNVLLSHLNGEMTPNIFYVSNSEWNLYPMLKNFMEISGLPKGVFQLNKLKIGIRDLIFNTQRASLHGHKYDTLLYLVERFKYHQLILVGDTGQYDPNIYARIIEDHPNRVLGVVLRRSGGKKANERNQIEINRLRDFNVPCSVID